MDQRYNTKNVQQNMGKTSAMPGWKENKIIKQMAKEGNPAAIKAKKLLGKDSLSTQEVRALADAKKEIGILKNVGTEQMVNRIKKQVADEAKAAETNISPTAFRKKNIQQPIVGTKGVKSKPMTSIAQINPAGHSALAGRENIAKGEGAFVSAARAQEKKQAPAEKKEEKPVAVDLMID